MADTPSVKLFARLFMDDYQRRLDDPAQYRAPVDAKTLIADIKSGATGTTYHETVDAMVSSAEDELRRSGKITLAGVVEQKDSMEAALSSFHPECLHEFGVMAKLGSTMLADHLVTRLNLLSRGIKPGAAELLADAFGKVD